MVVIVASYVIGKWSTWLTVADGLAVIPSWPSPSVIIKLICFVIIPITPVHVLSLGVFAITMGAIVFITVFAIVKRGPASWAY